MTQPAPLLAAVPQINFTLGNPGAPGVIYVSDDPAANQLSLVVTPTVAATYTKGVLVELSDAPADQGSILFLDLTPLDLAPAVFAGLKLEAEGWTSKPFVDDQTQQCVIAFTPTGAVPPGADSITFKLTGLALPAAPAGGGTTLNLSAFNVGGIIEGEMPTQSGYPVSFAAPPGTKADLRKVLNVTLTPSDVVTSDPDYPQVSNTLMLTLAQSGEVAIPADGNTLFTLTVVYATDVNGFGALLNAAEGDKISIQNSEGNPWKKTTNVAGLHGRYWELTPEPGDSIMGPAGAPVSFEISPLVSTFQPGATVALLSYSGVPGYADGAFPLTILKWPHVRIDSLSVDPPVSTLVNDDASVTLSWSAANTTQMTMQPLGLDVSAQTQCPADISDTQIFTLVAQGIRPGNVDNVASLSVTAVVLPVINAFTATPPSIYIGDFGTSGYRATLAWNVNIDEQDSVNLKSSTTGMVGSFAPAVPNQPITLQSPQMLTLTPVGAQGSPTVDRSLIVSAFTLAPQTIGIGHDSGFAAAPSNADFLAVTSPSENAVSILSSALATAHFQAMTTVPVGAAPRGIAFSPDGSRMLVANSGDGTVSVFAVAAVSAQPPFTFTSQGIVQVGGAPQSIAMGPDGTAYVTVDLGASTPGQVAVLAKGPSGYTAGTPVSVGNAPRGLAISPSGAELYVVNQGSGSVSRVTLGLSPPAVVSLITGLNGPTDVTVTTDGSRFLVSSTGDNQVFGYNARFPTTAEKQSYSVSGPGYFGLLAGGHYALVTASGNQIALLNYEQATVPATCQLSAPAQSVTVPPGGGFALATMPGTSSVGLIVLAGYSQVAAATPAGGMITSVIVSPDDETLIAWFNASIAVSSGLGAPITGLLKGPANGAAFSPFLVGTKINAVAASPVVADDLLYVGAHHQSAVSIYRLSTLASVGSVVIPALPGHSSRQVVGLGVSGDGATIFALTSDGGNQFSIVVIAAGSQSIVADLVVYQARMGQLSMPFAVAPRGVGGFAAYTVDTTTSNLWTVSGSGTNYSASGAPIPLGPGENAIATALACSPDGSTAYVALQSSSEMDYLSVVDLSKGTANTIEQADPTSTMNLTALAVSPDGNSLFASDSAAAGIRVFDARSLRIQQTLSWQEDVLSPAGLAVAADGSALYSANLESKNLSIAQQINPA